MYTAAYLIICKFEALVSPIQFVYRFPTTVGVRESHLKHFGLNG